MGEATDDVGTDRVVVLETNLDDVSGEVIGHCTTQLLAAGALDVYTAAIQMKKNRPGVTLSVLCDASQLEVLEGILFRETSTLGVRRWTASRRKLDRQTHTVATAWGDVAGIVATLPDGSQRFAPEYEACREVAAQHDVPLRDVYVAAQRAYRSA